MAINWRAEPGAITVPAIDQVNDKMRFLEQKADQFLNNTRDSLGELGRAVSIDSDFNENLDDIDIENVNVGEGIVYPEVPQLPSAGSDDNLDTPNLSYIAVPNPIAVNDSGFTLPAPVVPDITSMSPPPLLPPNPINLAHLTVPSAPDQIETPVLGGDGIDYVATPEPAQVPTAPDLLNTPDLAATVQNITPDFAPLPELEGFTLPPSPQAPMSSGLSFTSPSLNLNGDYSIGNADFGEAEPQMLGFNAPSVPQLNKNYALPAKPQLDFSKDEAVSPDVTFDKFPELRELNLREYEYEALPEFEGDAPALDEVRDAVQNYQGGVRKDLDQLLENSARGFEDQFATETKILQAQYGRLADWVEGEDTPWSYIYRKIENLLYSGTQDRETKSTERAVQMVRDEWSARGFTAPQGALDKRMDAIREEGRMRVAEANRTISVESFNKQLDEVRFLIEKGLQLEEILYKRYADKRDYELQIYKYRLEAYWNIYNATVQMYNAENEAFKMYFELHKLKVEQQFRELEQYKTYLESKRMEQDLTKQEIEVYQIKLQALNLQVEVYNSQLKAIAQRNDTLKSEIELYRAEVDAVSTEIDFDKLRLDMYKTELDAEKSKLSVNDQLIQNYTNRVAVFAQKNDIAIKNQSAKIEVDKIRLGKFESELAHEKLRIDYQLAEAQNTTSNFLKSVEMYKIDVEKRLAEIDYTSKVADMTSRTNIANAELTGTYANINSRITLSNIETASKVMETQSKISLANLDALTRHQELSSRVGMNNLESQVKIKEANARIAGINADILGKNADIRARVALSNAEMISKHNEIASRTALANLDVQTKVAVSEAEIAARYAEINARNSISATETHLKWTELQQRHASSQLDVNFKQTELSTRVALANQDILAKNSESNMRIATSLADLKARFADMRSRTNIANMQAQSTYVDTVSRINIATIDSKTRIAESNARMAMARADILMKKYDFNMAKGLEKSKLAVEAAKSVGTINAQLAAGAMSAIHVSAGISASGSVALSSSTNESESESTSHNYSY